MGFCCLLISLLIPPFLSFHIYLHLHLQPHIHLHALWAAHSLCLHSLLPSWSSSWHQWPCPSHRQVFPAHLSLDFDSWYTFGISTSHPLKFRGLQASSVGTEDLEEDQFGHWLFFEEKQVHWWTQRYLFRSWGDLAAHFKTKQGLGVILIFSHPV